MQIAVHCLTQQQLLCILAGRPVYGFSRWGEATCWIGLNKMSLYSTMLLVLVNNITFDQSPIADMVSLSSLSNAQNSRDLRRFPTVQPQLLHSGPLISSTVPTFLPPPPPLLPLPPPPPPPPLPPDLGPALTRAVDRFLFLILKGDCSAAA